MFSNRTHLKVLVLSLLAIVLSGVLSGCSNSTKKMLGITSSGPDEYQVTSNRPLEMPPHFDINSVRKEKDNREEKSHDSLNSAEQDLLNHIK
jgi:hypothetical protein